MKQISDRDVSVIRSPQDSTEVGVVPLAAPDEVRAALDANVAAARTCRDLPAHRAWRRYAPWRMESRRGARRSLTPWHSKRASRSRRRVPSSTGPHSCSATRPRIYEDLLNGTEQSVQPLDNIIRIRAVQDFNPSECLRFIPLLKNAIREELRKELADKMVSDELMVFELKIDNMILIAFDIYMKCREKIYDLKVRELQSWTFRRLQKADEVYKKDYPSEDINNQTIEFNRKEVAK